MGELVFEGFELSYVDVGDVTLRVRHGGSGPPVLLIHGHPRTHATWHRVAPLLAEHHTVVCPDLRGYGQSTKAPTVEDHATYSKRAMAADLVTLMRKLGHESFHVVGHDRGAYVAHRLALDTPDAVSRLVILDGVPIAEALGQCDAEFAAAWWHWFFLAQPEPTPERVINLDPEAWYTERGDSAQHMGKEAWEDVERAIHDPETVHAMCEDYRAGLGVDRDHDAEDRKAGHLVTSPMMVVWAGTELPDLYGDVVEVWKGWATDVQGTGLDSGHHMAEEVPDELAASLLQFFRS